MPRLEDPSVKFVKNLIDRYGFTDSEARAAMKKFHTESGSQTWGKSGLNMFEEWFTSPATGDTGGDAATGPGGDAATGRTNEEVLTGTTRDIEANAGGDDDIPWVDFEAPDRTDPDDIEMPIDAPDFEPGEYEDLPEYLRPEEVDFGEAYERSDFYSFTEGDYEALEDNIFTSFMRKVEPTIEAEMAERGLSRSSDFERSIGQASVEGAERATMARYGIQGREQERRTAFDADQQLLEWQSGQDLVAQKRMWEDEQTRREHLSEVAGIGARNEYEQATAAQRYGAEWGQYQTELGYRSGEAARRSQEDWQRSMAEYQDWLNEYSAATGEVTRPIDYYPYQGQSYMPAGDNPVAAAVGGASSAWTEYLKRGGG